MDTCSDLQMFDTSTTKAKYLTLVLMIVNVSCPKVDLALQRKRNSVEVMC